MTKSPRFEIHNPVGRGLERELDEYGLTENDDMSLGRVVICSILLISWLSHSSLMVGMHAIVAGFGCFHTKMHCLLDSSETKDEKR